MIIFLLTLFIISIVLLIPTILLQSNGASNGMMSAQSMAGAFGAKSNEILVKFTTYCVTIFICSALLLSIHFIRLSNVSYMDETEQAVDQQVVEGDDMSEFSVTDLPLAE